MKKLLFTALLVGFSSQAAVAAPAVVTAPVTVGTSSVSNPSPSSSANTCLNIAVDPPKNVNMDKVREAWISWYNGARAKNGLSAYVYNEALNETAGNWSLYAKKRGYIDHKRAGQKSYYDYKKVGAWFAQKGVTFVRGKGKSDYVENIGWDYYSCSSTTEDCTDNLIAAIKHTYNFFMSEKGKKYRAHYDSIMSKSYREIGLGIAVDPAKKRYYLTVHYGTDVQEKDGATCVLAPSLLPVAVEGDHKF